MSNNRNNQGALVLSLDYEMMWGILDLPSAMPYAYSNVKYVSEVIKRMVDLFDKYQVKATFATVGMVMCKDKIELMEAIPSILPSYTNQGLSPYGKRLEDIQEYDYPLFFSPETIELLKKSKMVEIGTHTFCHYYCWEDGQTLDQFEADIVAAINIASINGIKLNSIVFPRNNVNESYLEVCYKYGITSYRGNALKFFGKSKSRLHSIFKRSCRLIDSYIPLTGRCSYKYCDLFIEKERPINIPASRFFRPYSQKLRLLEPLKIRRIKNEIKYAATHGEVYHLWWHPHNFGANLNKNIKDLEKVLQYYSSCREKYGMQSYTMNELSEIIINTYGK